MCRLCYMHKRKSSDIILSKYEGTFQRRTASMLRPNPGGWVQGRHLYFLAEYIFWFKINEKWWFTCHAWLNLKILLLFSVYTVHVARPGFQASAAPRHRSFCHSSPSPYYRPRPNHALRWSRKKHKSGLAGFHCSHESLVKLWSKGQKNLCRPFFPEYFGKNGVPIFNHITQITIQDKRKSNFHYFDTK